MRATYPRSTQTEDAAGIVRAGLAGAASQRVRGARVSGRGGLLTSGGLLQPGVPAGTAGGPPPPGIVEWGGWAAAPALLIGWELVSRPWRGG